jgi:hypothetical protein
MFTSRRIGLLILSALTLTLSASCSSGRHSQELVFVLMANNQLAVVEGSGRAKIDGRISLGQPSPLPRQGQYLRFNSDRTLLFVLVPKGAGTSDLVSVVDIRSLTVKATWPLDPSTSFRSIDVGSRTGNVYLFGNRGADIVIVVLDPRDGNLLNNWNHHPADDRDWTVYQGLVSEDEATLFVSYHGADTTGIDFFQVADGLTRCISTSSAPNSGCLEGHGKVALVDGRLYVATGGPLIYEYVNGERVSSVNTLLNGNHLTEFAVDSSTNRLFAIGSCGYTGGLSATDLTTKKTSLIVAPSPGNGARPASPCGERIILGARDDLIVAHLPRPVPRTESIEGQIPSSVIFARANGGTIRAEVALPSDPLDIVFDQQ